MKNTRAGYARWFIIAFALVGFSPADCSGQGTLIFNSSTALVRLENGVACPVGGGQVQFAWAPLGAPFVPFNCALTAEAWKAANPGWTVLGQAVDVGYPIAGRFNGGTLTANTTPPGAIIQGVVIGWTGTGATDFLEGYQIAVTQPNGAFAVTFPFTVDTGDPTIVPPGTPGSIYNSTATPFTGLVITCMPEPSAVSLLLLGGLIAFIRSRRH